MLIRLARHEILDEGRRRQESRNQKSTRLETYLWTPNKSKIPLYECIFRFFELSTTCTGDVTMNLGDVSDIFISCKLTGAHTQAQTYRQCVLVQTLGWLKSRLESDLIHKDSGTDRVNQCYDPTRNFYRFLRRIGSKARSITWNFVINTNKRATLFLATLRTLRNTKQRATSVFLLS